MAGDEVMEIHVGRIEESPTNPRRNFGDMKELVASVKAVGVLQPVTVRRRPDGGKGFELVFGHRRLRAARSAGLELIRAIAVTMTDEQVIEAQLIENCQRQDIHPMDEAEAFETLNGPGYAITTAEIAKKIGKSESYVRQRQQLLGLTPRVRKAFVAGAFNPTVALLLARVRPAASQEKAAAEVTKQREIYDDDMAGRGEGDEGKFVLEGMSARQAAQHIHRHYMLELSAAPWKKDDETLDPKAGSCKACPKRTGNQGDLFGEPVKGDLCTDSGCYAGKMARHTKRVLAEAAKAGQRVLDEKERKAVFAQYEPTEVAANAPYVDLDAEAWVNGKRKTWRQRLPKGVPTALAVDAEGRLHTLVAKSDLAKALPREEREPANDGGASTKWRNAERARQKKMAREKVVAGVQLRVTAKALGKVLGRGPAPDEVLRMLVAGTLANAVNDTHRLMVGALGLTPKKGQFSADYQGTLAAHGRAQAGAKLREFAAFCLLVLAGVTYGRPDAGLARAVREFKMGRWVARALREHDRAAAAKKKPTNKTKREGGRK